MRRREFIALLGATIATWPSTAEAQQANSPVVGVLHTGAPEAFTTLMDAFRKGLAERGYAEGQNVVIEYRWAHNDSKRVPDLANELVRRKVTVIVTPIGTETVRIAMAATSEIPIVFSTGVDPVQAGLVASINRPGGNATGVANLTAELTGKRLGLLRELLPRATRIALLVNQTNPGPAQNTIKDALQAASALGFQIDTVSASTVREIDAAFLKLGQIKPDALLVQPEPLFVSRRVQIAMLAARHAVPAVYPVREFVDAGGLVSYGPSNADRYRLLGIYTGRILKGEKPADLPVMQATKIEFVINLPTARALGVELPPMLLARADAVIE
jgi:putative tryptophan/tyrosine transport system substrate-binding protein